MYCVTVQSSHYLEKYTMIITQLIQELTVDKPSEIFKKVVKFNSKIADPAAMARVRLGLVSGFVLEGIPLKTDREGHALFLGSNDSISYVRTASIAGIELLNPELLLSVLTEGGYFEVPASKVPTNLQLKRFAKTVSDKLKNNHSIGMDVTSLVEAQQTDAGKYQLRLFLELLLQTIETISTDALGKEAINALKIITLTEKEGELNVQKTESILEIGIDLNHELPSTIKEQLQEKLEAQL